MLQPYIDADFVQITVEDMDHVLCCLTDGEDSTIGSGVNREPSVSQHLDDLMILEPIAGRSNETSFVGTEGFQYRLDRSVMSDIAFSSS
jgi:hypothetical protein